MKAFLVSILQILLVAASFCKYQAHTENNLGDESGIKSQGLFENKYKKHCLNAEECYDLVAKILRAVTGHDSFGENDVKCTLRVSRLKLRIEKMRLFCFKI